MAQRKTVKKQPLVIVYRRPHDLNPFEANAREHSDAQIDEIAASIQRFGFTTPVALRDDAITIGAGHGRTLAALRILAQPNRWGPLNTPDGRAIPTITLTGLTETEWRAWVIADNRLAEKATWNFDALAVELSALKGLDPDLTGLAGFTEDETAALLSLGVPPDLATLQQKFGTPAASDFWPKVSIAVPEKVKKKFDSAMAQARAAGEDEWRRFEAVLDAVDPAKLPQAEQ